MVLTIVLLPILLSGWEDGVFNHPEKPGPLPVYTSDYWVANHDFDVLNYDIDMTIDIPAESVWADVTITLETLSDTLDTLRLHFNWPFYIESVVETERELDWELSGKQLSIPLERQIEESETLSVKISYHGRPATEHNHGLTIDDSDTDTSVTYTHCEPQGARLWIPCYDDPSDKATFTQRITVPSGYLVVANGSLESENRTGDWWTYTWREHYPQPTYDIALYASRNFVTRSTSAEIDGTEVPMTLWLLANNVDSVEDFYSKAPLMLGFLSDIFPSYPFADEKYDHVHTGYHGMEHTTCTALNTHKDFGAYYVWNRSWDWVVLHEMAHHWWGNWITCATWADLWLNEGFATYCEALWFEHDYGLSGYRAHMSEIMYYYIWRGDNLQHPLYDPPWEYLFDGITYDKGGFVLHMLRWILGYETFVSGMNAYAHRFANSTATTQEFQEVMEEVAGEDLDWFFEQWVFEQGHPHYEIAWFVNPPSYESKAACEIEFAVAQTQNQSVHYFPFRMPLEIEVYSGNDTILYEFTDSAGYQRFTVEIDQEPDSFVLDPANKVLCNVTYHADIDDVPQVGVGEQPQTETLYVQLSVDHVFSNLLCVNFSNPGGLSYTLSLYDASGRRIKEYYSGQSKNFHRIYPLPELATGLYFVCAEFNDGSAFTVKTIKIR